MKITNWNVSTVSRSYSTSSPTPEKSTTGGSNSLGELAAIYEKSSYADSTYESLSTYSAPKMALATAEDPPPVYPVYDDWLASLSEGLDTHVRFVIMRIDEDPDGFKDEELPELIIPQMEWLDLLKEDLDKRLTQAINDETITFEEAVQLFQDGEDFLDQLDAELRSNIKILISDNQTATSNAHTTYSDWDKMLSNTGNSFLQNLEALIKGDQAFISEDTLKQYLGDLDSWVTARSDELATALSGAPPGIRETLLESSQTRLQTFKQTYSSYIHQQVYTHNYPPKPASADSLFTDGKQKFEFTVGNSKASLTLRLSSSQSSSSSFYVIDAKGIKKKVHITFDNANLQREFDKHFKESSFGKGDKTLSLEKLNSFIRSIKDSLKSISDTDMERLRSELYEKAESTTLDKKFSKFLAKLQLTVMK